MDKKTNQNYQALIIIIVVLIAVIIMLFMKNSDKENVTVSDNNATSSSVIQGNITPPTPVVKPVAKEVVAQVNTNIETNKNLSVEEVRNCAQQSKALFDYHYGNVTQNGLYPIKGSLTYTNHLNTKEGKCYMVESLYGSPSSQYSGMGQGLYDVYENKSIASYSDVGGPYSCSINGVYGCTKSSFDVFVNSAMGN